MILNISNHKPTVIERGVYYFNLSNYAHINTIELSKIRMFINYEKSYGRETEIICEDEAVIAAINNADSHKFMEPTEDLFVYHATNLEAAQKILSTGKLLSATKAYKKTGEELAHEKRDSLWNDPPDYFEYIMFCWGSSMTGDYVVSSEDNEGDMENGMFNAGVRFYFRYNDLIQHPKCAFDGYHPIKIKSEIVLTDYLIACIVPKQFKNELEGYVMSLLVSRVHCLAQNELKLLDWNEKVSDFISRL